MLSLKFLFALTLAGAALCLPCQGQLEAQQGGPSGAQSGDPQRVLANAIQLHQAGDFEGAIRYYQTFLTMSPNDKSRVIAYSNLGAALAHLGRYDEAIEQYHHALKAIPHDLGETSAASEVRFNLA